MFLTIYLKLRNKTLPAIAAKHKLFITFILMAGLLVIPHSLFASYQVTLSETSMMTIQNASQIFFGIVIFITLVTTLFPVAITALGLQLTISGYDNVGMCFFFTGLFLTFYGKPKKKSNVRKPSDS